MAMEQEDEKARLKKFNQAALALAKACYFDHQDNIQIILDHAKPASEWINLQVRKDHLSEQKQKEELQESTTTCMCIASRYSTVAVVKQLCRHGADPMVANSTSNTPLHRACRSKRDVLDKVAYFLFHDKSLANMPNNENQTPLHVACLHSSVRVMTRMIEFGGLLYKDDDTFEDTPLYSVLQTNVDKDEKIAYLRAKLTEQGKAIPPKNKLQKAVHAKFMDEFVLACVELANESELSDEKQEKNTKKAKK